MHKPRRSRSSASKGPRSAVPFNSLPLRSGPLLQAGETHVPFAPLWHAPPICTPTMIICHVSIYYLTSCCRQAAALIGAACLDVR